MSLWCVFVSLSVSVSVVCLCKSLSVCACGVSLHVSLCVYVSVVCLVCLSVVCPCMSLCVYAATSILPASKKDQKYCQPLNICKTGVVNLINVKKRNINLINIFTKHKMFIYKFSQKPK